MGLFYFFAAQILHQLGDCTADYTLVRCHLGGVGVCTVPDAVCVRAVRYTGEEGGRENLTQVKVYVCTEHIENLILDNTLTLRQISDRMNFRSEYYFCAFFKKNAGTSPGKYRQLMLKR